MKLNQRSRGEYNDNKFLGALIVLFILYFVLYFYGLGSTGLTDVDEPRYAEAGREMLESGNWVVPYFNYVVRYDKPIFFYWLEALSMKAFGVNELAARLPSAITAIISAGFVFYFVRAFYGVVCGLMSALVLMSCFEFAGLARFSVTDMTLSCFIISSIISFFLGYNQLSTSHSSFDQQIKVFSNWYLSGFLFLGLAVLTKGPVAILLVGMVLVPFFWWIRKLSYFLKNYSFWIGFCIFIFLVMPWYLIVHMATEGDFTATFLGLHNFSRYTSTVSGHKGSLFYFIPVVLIGFLPWTFFLPGIFMFLLKKGLGSLLVSIKEEIPWLCLWWFLVVFLFFSVSKTKLLTYILSLFPALSILVAIWFDSILVKVTNNKGFMIGLGLFFVFCLIMVGVCLFDLSAILPREVKSIKLDFQIICLIFLMFVGVSMAWASSHKDESMSIVILLSTFLLFYFCLVAIVMPKIDKHAQSKLRIFARSIPPDVEISTYQIIKPSLTFYSKRKIEKYDSLTKIQEKLDQPAKFAFVTKKKLLENASLNNVYLWGKDDRYVFYKNYN